MKAVSTTSNDATGLHVSSTGSTFVNLVVGGTAISGTPAPNTVLTLSVGAQVVGTVTLNEQVQSIGASSAALTVNMIHVKLTADIPGVGRFGVLRDPIGAAIAIMKPMPMSWTLERSARSVDGSTAHFGTLAISTAS